MRLPSLEDYNLKFLSLLVQCSSTLNPASNSLPLLGQMTLFQNSALVERDEFLKGLIIEFC